MIVEGGHQAVRGGDGLGQQIHGIVGVLEGAERVGEARKGTVETISPPFDHL